MFSEVYKQLTLMSNFFTRTKTTFTINLATATKIAEANPLRVYIAFSVASGAGGFALYNTKPTSTNDGFVGSGGQTFTEFFLERHLALVQDQWFIFPTNNSTVVVIEEFYTPSDYTPKEENKE